MTDQAAQTEFVAAGDAAWCAAFEAALRQEGRSVWVASDGRHALDALRRAPAIAVVVAEPLADLTTAEFQRSLLLDPSARETAAVYVSPKAFTPAFRCLLRPGLDVHWPQPMDPVLATARVLTRFGKKTAHSAEHRLDHVTRLLARETLEAAVAEDVNALERYRRFASLIFVEIEHFRRLTKQQPALSDLALTALAGLIHAKIRTTDLAGRMEGSRFLVYLPETRLPGARVFVERLWEQYRAVTPALIGEELSFYAGLVETPRDGADFATIMARAEGMLNEAAAIGGGTFRSPQ